MLTMSNHTNKSIHNKESCSVGVLLLARIYIVCVKCMMMNINSIGRKRCDIYRHKIKPDNIVK